MDATLMGLLALFLMALIPRQDRERDGGVSMREKRRIFPPATPATERTRAMRIFGIPVMVDICPPYQPTDEEVDVMNACGQRQPLTEQEREQAGDVIDSLAGHGLAPERNEDGSLFWTRFSSDDELNPPRRRR